MLFDEFLARQKVRPKSKISAALADKLKKRGWFWRGRQERRCAGEEKEEGLCCRSSKILPESIQLRVQHAAPKVAADLWASASSADLRFCFCFVFVIMC